MIPGSANPLLLASAAAGGYQVQRSLRFNSSDSGFCSRTPGTASNRKTWTWAAWVKRSAISFSAEQHIWGVTGTTDDTYGEMYFGTGDTLRFGAGYNTVAGITTTRVFRDPGAWFHLVLAFDATQATAANKIRLYVNGVEETAFSSDTRSSLSNQDWGYNNNVAHYIGRNPNSNIRQFNGYLADIHFIDGQALTPSSFTEVSATTGQLIPLAYSGSYGTNGFKLKFSDNSAATAATLGADTSGNGNNWTPNNLSVTAGAGNDSLVDTPTSYGTDTGVGGEVRGNYATWNPLQSSAATLTNGNLDCTTATATGGQVRATIAVSSGKWYWEVTVNTTVSANNIGIIKTSEALAADEPGYFAGGYSYVGSTGNKRNNASASAYGATYGSGDVIGVALDLTAGTLVFYKNGASQGTAFSSLTGEFIPCVGDGTGSNGLDMTTNFGQRAFAYPVSGYKALVDTNLGAPVVAKPNTLMDVKLYTGNGSTQTVSGLNFSPDLVWIKKRSDAASHNLLDTVRGARVHLESNTTNSEYTESAGFGLTAFNSDGFSLGTDNAGPGQVNASGGTFVAWAWDAGTSTVSNTAGSITSQVRANPSAGFSVVTYTGNGTAGATIGHGLGVAPELIIVKVRTQAYNWFVYHKQLSETKYIKINTTDAAATLTTAWNNTAPTSTVFSIGTDGSVNQSSATYVAYCFAPVVGYSSFGSYVGNGSSDGPMVWTGMRPRWILIKRSDSADDWNIFDTTRSAYNVMGNDLLANRSDAEYTGTYIDSLSNGFKIRETNASRNASGGTYIYCAFAESPFQYARAR